MVNFVSAETRTFNQTLSVGQTYSINMREYNGMYCRANDSFLNVSYSRAYRNYSRIYYDYYYYCPYNGYSSYNYWRCRRRCSYRYCNSYTYIDRYTSWGEVSANVTVSNTSAWIESDRTSTVTCTYSSKVSDPTSAGGTLKYKFTIKAYTEDVSFSLIKNVDESYNLFNKNTNTGTYLISNFKRVERLENDTSRTTSGNRYLNTNCSRNSTNTCTFSINSSMTASKPIQEANYKLKFKDNNNYYKQARVKVRIYPYKNVIAMPTSYGTCNFGSSWTKSSNREYVTPLNVGSTLTLPNCTANTAENPLLKFAGWIDVGNDFLSSKMQTVQKNGDCSRKYNATFGSITMNKNTGRIIACYEYDKGVVLGLSGGDFNLPASAVVNGQLAYIKTSSRFTLPDVESLPALYNLVSDGYFVGWRDEEGNIHNPLTSVYPNGQKYVAVFGSRAGMDVSENTKLVYVGGNEIIAEKGKITKCEITDSTGTENLSVNISNGHCVLFGLKETGNMFVPVEVTLTNGEKKTYHVKVQYQEGNFADPNTGIVDLSTLLDFSIDDGSATTVDGAVICDRYTVYPLSGSVGYLNFASNGSTSLDIWQYRAKSHCENVDHMALCMDPGRPGPRSSNHVVYEPDETFDMDSTFGQVVSHIVKVLIDEGVVENSTVSSHKVAVAAANIATRLVQYFDPSQLASSSTTAASLSTHLTAYKKVGQKLVTDCSPAGGLADCSRETIIGALNSWSWNNSEIKEKVADLLVAYNTTTTDRVKIDSNLINNEVDEDHAVIEYTPSAIRITVNGKLTGFDSSIDLTKLTMKNSCSDLFECDVIASGAVGNEWPYTIHLTIKNENIQNFLELLSPSKKSKWPAIQLDVKGTGMTAANVFVLHAVNGANYQRMAIFNTESTTLKASIDFSTFLTCKNFYDGVDASGEPKPTFYTPSVLNIYSTDFDPVVFKAAGCCREIDINSNIYKNYCEEFCTTHNWENKCDPLSTNPETDVYSLKEGYIDDEKNLTCIVDVTPDKETSMKKTKEKIDFSGNDYTVFSNKYCAISCREEWNIAMPSYNHFVHNGTKDNAVRAGTYFSINRENLFLGTKRTCYTSYIDYASYVTEQQDLSRSLVNKYNELSEYMKVKSEIEASADRGATVNVEYTKDWVFSHTRKCYPWNCGTDEEPETCWKTCYVYNPVKAICTRAVVELPRADFDTDTYVSRGNIIDGITSAEIVDGYDGSVSRGSLGVASSDGDDSAYAKIMSRVESGPRPEPLQSSVYRSNEGECCGVNGTAYNCQSFDHNDLKDSATYDGGDVDYNVTRTKSELNSIREKMFGNAEAFNNCQNFYLENTSEVKRFNAVSKTTPDTYGYYGGKLFSDVVNVNEPSDSPSYSIETKFEPEATYTYEEEKFMNELALDLVDGRGTNYIVPNVEVNGGVANNSCQEIDLIDSIDGKELALCNNELVSKAFNENWEPYSEQAKTYNNDGRDDNDKHPSEYITEFNIPMCTYASSDFYDEGSNYCVTAQSVVYRAHYITRSLRNSSYYANKGHWYVDNTNDVKSHGDSKQIAVSHHNYSMEEKFTVIFGAKYNTFPISLDTPRNQYQYIYTFKDIGYFNDGEVGRIMGDKVRGMIKNNERACFYEVYEELCKCCGDPFTWYKKDKSLIDETETYLDSKMGPDYFNKSSNTYTSRHSRFGVVASSVSLYDLSCKSKFPPGTEIDDRCINAHSNWGSKDSFLYDGELYTTRKGLELRRDIISRGEEIYNTNINSPEYSYTLTPAVMSRIKQENGKYRYGYTSETVDIFGSKVCFKGGISATCTLDSEDAGYFHFKSNFLEKDFMVAAITGEFAARVNHNKSVSASCVVYNAADAHSKNCRWVDYAQTTPAGTIVLALK